MSLPLEPPINPIPILQFTVHFFSLLVVVASVGCWQIIHINHQPTNIKLISKTYSMDFLIFSRYDNESNISFHRLAAESSTWS